MASASGYNHQRFARAVLKKSRKWEPSLTVQLHQTSWRFENSQMTFPYHGPMLPFLLALRSQVIPASLIPFLYDIRPPVSFVDGCLVVEIQDYRKSPNGEPQRSRIVMRPAAEALAQTIDGMLERKGIGNGQGGWSEEVGLELESRIIAATSPPLYLGPSPLAHRNATLALLLTSPAPSTLSATGSYRDPDSFSASSSSAASSEAERLRKLLRAGTERAPGTFTPNWSILRLKERIEAQQRVRERERVRGGSASAQGSKNGAGAEGSVQGGGGAQPPTEKKKTKKKRPAPADDAGGGEGGAEPPKKSKKKKVDTAAGGEANGGTGGAAAGKKKAAAGGGGGGAATADGAPPKKKKKAAKKDEE